MHLHCGHAMIRHSMTLLYSTGNALDSSGLLAQCIIQSLLPQFDYNVLKL